MTHRGFKNAIVQSLFFHILFFSFCLWLAMSYTLPEYLTLEGKKVELLALSNQHNDLQKSGLKFSQFKNLYTLHSRKTQIKDLYMETVLKEIPLEDYNTYFKNTGGKHYGSFLEDTVVKISRKKEKISREGKNDTLRSLLPDYIGKGFFSENQLTDFRFINHMEGLLHSFRLNLSPSTQIGIGTLDHVDSLEKNNELLVPQSGLEIDGDIYFFRQKLLISGHKKNIINFLHYIEHIAQISSQGDEIHINNSESSKDFIDIKRYFPDAEKQGIYNSFLMEIEKIGFVEYLDSSKLSTPEGDSSLGFIKRNQANEPYSVELTLRVYVQGLPSYKKTDYILQTVKSYNKLQMMVSESLKEIGIKKKHIIFRKKLKNINRYLLGIKNDITHIEQGAFSNDMEGLYKKSHSLQKIFLSLSRDIVNDLEGSSAKLYKKHKSDGKK